MKFFSKDLLYQKIESNYTPLVYIKSTGTQYIDALVEGRNNITSIAEIEFETAPTVETSVLSSGRGSASTRMNLIYSKGGYFTFGYGRNETYTNVSIQSGVKYKIESSYNYGYQEIMLDNTSIYTNTLSANVSSNSSLYIFARNSGSGPANYASVKLYSLKLIQDGVTVRDFIPVLDGNNVPCLYDKIGENYYSSLRFSCCT